MKPRYIKRNMVPENKLATATASWAVFIFWAAVIAGLLLMGYCSF